MLDKPHLLDDGATSGRRGLLGVYCSVPLYVRILAALAIGILLGELLGKDAEHLKWVSKIILRFLGALAPALILVAVMDSILNAKLQGRSAGRLAYLLVLNTLVAIFIGLLVANLIQPGKHNILVEKPKIESQGRSSEGAALSEAPPTTSGPSENSEGKDPVEKPPNAAKPDSAAKSDSAAKPAVKPPPDAAQLREQLFDNIPKSVLEPLVNNNVIGVVFLAVAFGVAFRQLSDGHDLAVVNQFISLSFKAVVVILHWVIELVPLAVLCTVAATVGEEGFAPLLKLLWFVAAVLIALSLQVVWYMSRIYFGCWAKPKDVLLGVRDALVMAFSTASSTATMPVTYASLRDKVGLREDSASMGSLVGANFNNDGTALYEAVAALFVAQWANVDLSLGQQLLVVLMAVVASVGAAGIPEAGLVTMALVFKAVDLPLEYIPLLLPVDWFLDRCRTAINVLGDVNVSCMLEGKTRVAEIPATAPAQAVGIDQTPDTRPPDTV